MNNIFYSNEPGNYSENAWNIQGEPINQEAQTQEAGPSGFVQRAYDAYSTWTSVGQSADNPAGDGENLIPATAPSTVAPIVPGQPLDNDQIATLDVQGDVPQDPLNSAVNANAQALKDSGKLVQSTLDVQQSQLNTGVLSAVPSGDNLPL